MDGILENWYFVQMLFLKELAKFLLKTVWSLFSQKFIFGLGSDFILFYSLLMLNILCTWLSLEGIVALHDDDDEQQ